MYPYGWRSLSLSLVILGGSGLLNACQLKVPQGGLPEAEMAETELIPASTPFLISFTAQPDKLASEAPAHQAEIEAQVRQAEAELLEKTQVDYRQDIAPWIGEQWTMAVVDPSLVPDAEEPVPGVLFAASTKNAAASQQFLEKVRRGAEQQLGAQFEQQQQKGVTLNVQTNGQTGEQWVTAEFGKQYVAIANDPQVMNQAIAVYTNQQDSLAENPRFQAVVRDRFTSDVLLFAYLNTPAIFADPELAERFPPNMDVSQLEQLQELQGISVTGQWQDSGFLLRAQMDIDPTGFFRSTPVQAASSKLIETLPGNALAVFTSNNLALNWQNRIERLADDPQAQSGLQQFRETFQQSAGLDFDKDVISWMDGEVALAMIPDAKSNPLLQGIGAVLMIESNRKQQAEVSLKKLDQTAQNSGLRVTQSQDQVIWSDFITGQPLVTRVWSGNRLIVTSSTATLATLTQGEGDLLPATEPFKSLTSSLTSPNYGYFLINFGVVVTAVEAAMPVGLTTLDPESRQALTTLSGIGLTSYPVDPDSYGVDLLFMVTQQP